MTHLNQETEVYQHQNNLSHQGGDHPHVDHDHNHHNHSSHDHSGHDHSGHDHSGHDHSGHDHSGHAQVFKKKFFISLVLGLPILFIAPMMGITLPFQFTFNGSETVVAILATALFFYGGEPFLSGAKDELKDKNPAMMTLVSLGIIVAYIYSMFAYINNILISPNSHIMDFFWELSSLILIMLLGHWIEMDAISSAGNAVEQMAKLLPSEATIIDADGNTSSHPLSHVQKGDVLIVAAGENVPADGVIIQGSSYINESMITGESVEIKKVVGDTVIGGSVNGSGVVHIEVTGTGESGYLAQVMELVKAASSDKSKAESMADKVAQSLFYIAAFTGILTLTVWTMISGTSTGVERMVTVLVIACPHALGLAIPLVTARSTSIAAKNGLLIKSRQALEIAQDVTYVMMDKTGTLTEGNFEVTTILSHDASFNEDQVLEYFAALESSSSHPLAVGIMSHAKRLGTSYTPATDVLNIPGVGLQGHYKNSLVQITSVVYLQNNNINYNLDDFNRLAQFGYSVSYLIVDGKNMGLIALGDEIKKDSKRLIDTLKRQGMIPVMLTGDNKDAAKVVASYLGLDHVHSQLMPEDKERIIREYQTDGSLVIMVGDGVNDAPSLARSDVGIAIGAGTDVAIDSADVILVKSNPLDILNFLKLAKRTNRKMKENLLWGAGYNFLAIPLAAGILAPFGFLLSPAVGAILMSASTIIVAINAMLLKID